MPSPWPADAAVPRLKGAARPSDDQPALAGNTTIAIIATDAVLTKPQAKRLAAMAHAGMARALYPAHTPFDGDLVFALATGRQPLAGLPDFADLGIQGANALARAIARGVHAATARPGDLQSCWQDIAGRHT